MGKKVELMRDQAIPSLRQWAHIIMQEGLGLNGVAQKHSRRRSRAEAYSVAANRAEDEERRETTNMLDATASED
jgi:hypothetical protein